MKGDAIPGAHHVAHLCKAKHLLNDRSGCVGAAAFVFRETDQDGLSCNWLEFFASAERPTQLSQIKALLRLELRNSNRFAVVNCGLAREKVRAAIDLELSIVEDPLPAEGTWPADPTHTLIKRPPAESLEAVAHALALLAKAETIP